MSTSNLDTSDPTTLNRYLADQLSEAEREAFEAELVRRPETLRELESAARLKIGLARLRKRGELEPLLRPAQGLRSPQWFALAAGIALVVLALVLFRVSIAPAEPALLAAAVSSLRDGDGRPLQVGSVHALFHDRAEGADPVIEKSAAASGAELRVLAPQAEPALYRASLTPDGSDEPLGVVHDLQPAPDGFLSVFVDVSRLSPGGYRLTVSAQNAAGGAGDSFKILVVGSKDRVETEN
jgi:hypothetical protein